MLGTGEPDTVDAPKPVVGVVRSQLTKVEPPTETRTWDQIAPYYRDVIALQNNIMTVVMGMVFVLVLAGIVNTMMMSVFERKREVGTLMALGFRRRSILWLFIVEAFCLGAFSAAFGATLGLTVVRITHWTGIPFTVPAVGVITARPVIDWPYAFTTIGVAIATALVAGIYPAYKASRLQPIEALRAL